MDENFNIDESSLSLFSEHTIEWFRRRLGAPTPVQEQAWQAIHDGFHTLVSAPTGTGKTLAAFLVFIDDMKKRAVKGELERELQMIYISPLKSLASDIRENLQKPLYGITEIERETGMHSLLSSGINIAIRTGDTTTAERRRMFKHPPHILITTPESLFLLLTGKEGKIFLKSAKTVIIDELHAMIGSKRGSHLMLSLARLDIHCRRKLQRIGLSATVEPLELAAKYLVGANEKAVIAAPKMKKKVDIRVTSPLPDIRVIPEGTIWPDLARTVHAHCDGMRSVIAFVDGRMYSEKLSYYVNMTAGEGFARTHHGCISKEQRMEAENDLRAGKLRLLCATSSMELGIDVGDIDRVLQIGCPKSISGLMQRLGRAGHNPNRTSAMNIFPRTATEGFYCGLTAKVASDGRIEQSKPPVMCFDILAQHLVSMATDEGYTVDSVMEILPMAYPFMNVKKEDVKRILEMLAGDYEHKRDIAVRPRVLYDRINEIVRGDAYSRMLATSAGGTIPDMGMFKVKTENGVKLGELDEEFVFEARVGNKFLLGSFAWRITKMDRDTVTVVQTSSEGAQPPFWKNIWMSRSLNTSLCFGQLIRELGELYDPNLEIQHKIIERLMSFGMDESSSVSAEDIISRQIRMCGVLPDDRTIVIEHFSDEVGDDQIMIHSLFGKQINSPLAILFHDLAVKYCKAEGESTDFSCYEDDDGFLIIPQGNQKLPADLLKQISPDTARSFLAAILPSTSLFNMNFRYICARSLMMGIKGAKRTPLWVQRLRSAEMLDSIIKYPEHPLIRENTRECLEDFWDIPGVEMVLQKIKSGEIEVREIYSEAPSPFSLPIRRQAEAVLLYNYSPTSTKVISSAREAKELLDSIKPTDEQIEKFQERKLLPETPDRLHSLLMIEGDTIGGEIEVPFSYFEALESENRVLYIEPGLWIAAEHAAEYAEFTDAMFTNDSPLSDGMLHIIRRMLRYRNERTVTDIAQRYSLPEAYAERALSLLVERGEAICDNGIYFHSGVYERAVNYAVSERRKGIHTLQGKFYASALARTTRKNFPPEEQLRDAIERMIGIYMLPSVWENAVFPSRVNKYRPSMLDAELSLGSYFWQMNDIGEIAFFRYDDVDWDYDMNEISKKLETDEKIMFDALLLRGASFLPRIGSLLQSSTPGDILPALAKMGYVRADSFAPVRLMNSVDSGTGGIGNNSMNYYNTNRKYQLKNKVMTVSSGRWEVARPTITPDIDKCISEGFKRYILLCRETWKMLSVPYSWSSVLDVLRMYEYTGKIRRGYFIEGFSGAQFLQNADFENRVLNDNTRNEYIWLPASDTAQAWGKLLPHQDNSDFINVAGSSICLFDGSPIMLFERGGQALRVFDDNYADGALSAFATDYCNGKIYSDKNKIVVKKYPAELSVLLEKNGFLREMLDYTIYKK